MTVKYEMHTDAVALITLNRPQALNAFDTPMRADLLAALTKASADKAVRAVVMTGEGRGFCAGADVSDSSSPLTTEDMLNAEYGAFLAVIRTCDKPVIAAVNGPAAGIGMAVALPCDLRVIAEDAYLMPAFANIGLVQDGGLSWLMTQELGYARAYEIAIEAQKLGAARCLELGLVNRVAATEETVSHALDWASSLVERAPLANALTKRAFRAAAHDRLSNAIAFEGFLQLTAIASEDFQEGVSALFEMRNPVFKGR